MTAAPGTKGFIVRPATAGDLPDVHAVLIRSGLRSGPPDALDFYRNLPGGRIVVACQDDQVTGAAYSVSFGRTGWLGNVAVDPGARGRGIGTAVSAAALDWLRQAGVATVLLTATELGRPVYDRLGFVSEGVSYGIWQREQMPGGHGGTAGAHGAGGTDGAARAGGAGRADWAGRADGAAGFGSGLGSAADVARMDAEATGEDRGDLLRGFAGQARVAAGPGGTGYWLPLPWGGGPIVADGATAALALLIDMLRADPAPSLSFPEPNTGGEDLAAALGFRLARRTTRMRLGPPVTGFHPERIFNTFSLAVG